MTSETILIIAIYLFIITSLLFIGLDHSYRDILAPFKNVRLVIAALLVNLILIPATGFLLAGMFALSGAVLIGCILMTSAPGASYGPRLAEIAEGDVPFATGLMFLLSTVALVSTPITLLVVLPDASGVNIWPVIRTLILILVLPLIVGLIIRERYSRFADRIKDPVLKLSWVMILFVLIVALGTKLASPGATKGLVSLFGSYGILTIVLVVGISIIFGYFLGGKAEGTRRSLAIGSAIRNAGMAMLFTTSSFAAMTSDILAVLITFIIVQTVMVGIAAGIWRKRSEARRQAQG